MKKEPTLQANFRLPESLLSDLKFVSEETEETQTDIVRDSLQVKVETLKKRIQRKKEREELQEVAAV